MNSVNLTGRLTRDPELRSVQVNGESRSVCDMRVAVDGRGDEPVYVDVITWGPQADACAEYLSKGRQVGVEGRLDYQEWEAEDGSKRSKHAVVGRVEFLGAKPESGTSAEAEREEEPTPA